MSLAWATVVLVVLLVPGILFSLAVYIPEQFTRDTAPKSALGQLAGVVLVSFIVHGFLYGVLWPLCHVIAALPCINLRLLFILMDVGKPDQTQVRELADALADHQWAVLGYLAVAAGFGTLGGFLTGRGIVGGPLRFLAEHDWALDLPMRQEQGHTYAYVLTSISHEGRHLVYEGRVVNFGLLASGQFSYLVLAEAQRGYLRLDYYSATVDKKPHIIGSEPDRTRRRGRKKASYFFIQGSDVANAVLDSFDISMSSLEIQILRQLVTELTTADRADKLAEKLREIRSAQGARRPAWFRRLKRGQPPPLTWRRTPSTTNTQTLLDRRSARRAAGPPSTGSSCGSQAGVGRHDRRLGGHSGDAGTEPGSAERPNAVHHGFHATERYISGR
jgi:hypothetical protein